MTVSGVFSSCDASETKRCCSFHARSTGRTASPESRWLNPKSTASAPSPSSKLERSSWRRVDCSPELSVKAMRVVRGVCTRR